MDGGRLHRLRHKRGQRKGTDATVKKKIAMALLCICLFVLSAGITTAYLTAEDTARNAITTGEVAVSLVERQLADGAIRPYPARPIAVMPGQTVSKIVSAANDAGQPVWVRLRVEITGQGRQELPDGAVTLTEPGADWVYCPEDGWYYCTAVLAAGEETEPLFRGVSFSGTALDNRFADTAMSVSVTAQAVQAANNGGDVFAAQGWPEQAQGGERT